MANSDKNILITPSVGLSTNPTIRFNGANNAPTTLRVLDDGTVSFEGTAGQLFSISDGLTGSIFSVNDISGIPSIEALDTGLVKLNQYGGSTVFGASAAIQNSLAVNARVSIATGSASTPGLIVKGAASQTADLQQWQDSSSNVIAKVERAGAVSIEPSATPNGYSLFVKGSGSSGVITARSTSTSSHLLQFQNSSSTAVLRIDSEGRITPVTTSSVGLIIRSAASQSADLQQWQDSAGTTRSRIDLYGGFVTSVYASLYPSWSGGTPLFVSGLAGQTGNLTEWKNSAGTVLSKIDSIGSIFAPYAAIGTTPLAGAMTTINIAGFPSTPGLVIRGAASQTADLQQWQNSAGTVLGRVTSTGAIGIGTSSPTLGVALEAFATSYEPAIQVHALNNSRGGIAAFTNQRIALYTTSVADNLVFGYANTVNGANFVERMRLANSNGGLLLINSTSATLGGGSVASQLGVVAGAATTVGAVIRAAASQTADLQQWQNSSGALMARVAADGSFTAGGQNGATKFIVDQFGTLSLGTNRSITGTPTYLFVQSQLATDIGAVVKGAASQTADLQQWQNSAGTVVGKIESSGRVALSSFYYSNSFPTVYIGDAAYGFSSEGSYLRYFTSGNSGGGHIWYGGPNNLIPRMVVGNSGTLALYGIASQTANLTEWRNSSGTVLARVNSTGEIISGEGITGLALRTLNSYAQIGEWNSGTYFSWKSATASVNSGYGSGYAQFFVVPGTIAGTLKFTVRGGASGGETTILDNIDQTNGTANSYLITAPSASTTGLTVKGAASQTANLQEWRNVSDTVLASVDKDGIISAPAIKVVGQAISTNTTMVSGYRYFVDTAAARTLTLPASPSVGNEIQVFDASNLAGTNNITIDPNNGKIDGVNEQYLVDINGAAILITYTGSTFGWRITEW